MKTLIILIFALSINTFAKTQQVLKMTNDSDTEVNKVFINYDDINGQVLGLESITWDTEGNIVKELRFNTQEVLAGVVMVEMSERKIMILKATATDYNSYANLELDFLKNGITGSRGKFVFELRFKNGSWGVYKNNKLFTWAQVLTNLKPLVGTIGIKTIEIIE